jgi:hypothetical protein
MTTLLFEARKPQFSASLIALAFLGTLILGGAGGYVVKTLQSVPSSTINSAERAVDPTTGYAYGSFDDQRILEFLKQSGYEGGGTVVNQQGQTSRSGGPGAQVGDTPRVP